MAKSTNRLALTALGVSMAAMCVSATPCAVTVTVTATITTTAAARAPTCFPTERDCAVLVSYCAGPSSTATSPSRSLSASSSVQAPPGSRPPPVETPPYGRHPSGRGPATTATVPEQVTRLVPVPESSSRAGGGPSVSSSRAPRWGHHTYGRVSCSSSACIGSRTPSAPPYGSSSTSSDATFTVVTSATATDSVSASSSIAGSPESVSTSRTEDTSHVTATTTVDQTTTATVRQTTTAWPEHHAPSSSDRASAPYTSSAPGGYGFPVPVSSPVSSDLTVPSTATSFSESVDAATGSVSTSSSEVFSPGTTLLTSRKSPSQSHVSATGSWFGHSTSSYKPGPSQTSSAEAPPYAEPPSYRAPVRPPRQ